MDLFASPGVHQQNIFVPRYPHWQGPSTDASSCPLNTFTEVYTNPPSNVMEKWMYRSRENPSLMCLMITPLWASCAWWPQLLKMHVRGSPSIIIPPYRGMFKNCYGELMPAPRWPLICIVLFERAWNPKNPDKNINTFFYLRRKLAVVRQSFSALSSLLFGMSSMRRANGFSFYV